LVTQSELFNRICVFLGGIATEETIFQETSTGAQNDLERATDLARRMVTEFGMSPKLGRVNYHVSNRSPFLASGFGASTDRFHSEETIREIDLEIKRIVDEANRTAHDIIKQRRDVLEHMTRDLLENEVMNADQLQAILDEHKIGPQIKPGTHARNPVPKPTEPEQDIELPAQPAEGG
jgi:cell division protease FtsH